MNPLANPLARCDSAKKPKPSEFGTFRRSGGPAPWASDPQSVATGGAG